MTLPMAMAQRGYAFGVLPEDSAGSDLGAPISQDQGESGWLPNPYGGMLYNPRTHFINHVTKSAERLDEANRPTATVDNWKTWDTRNAAFEAARDAGEDTVQFKPAPVAVPALVAVIPSIVTPPNSPAAAMLNANRSVSESEKSGYLGAGRDAPAATYLKSGVLVDANDNPVQQLPTNNTTATLPADWKKYLPIAIALLVLVAMAVYMRRSKA